MIDTYDQEADDFIHGPYWSEQVPRLAQRLREDGNEIDRLRNIVQELLRICSSKDPYILKQAKLLALK